MKFVALIPARYAATRFPFKLMQKISENKTVIQLTVENALNSKIFDDVVTVCDEDTIYNHILSIGAKAIKSKKIHESGSDRIAEAAEEIDADVIVNIQGDEPFIDIDGLKKIKELFLSDTEKKIEVASLMQKITDAEADNPNNVKVVIDKNNKSLLFSRAKIPFNRDKEIKANYWLHIGVYAYRKDTLIRFSKLAQTPLEKIEKLENLRLLENGIPIHMIETFNNGIKIDVPEDLEAAKDFYNKNFK